MPARLYPIQSHESYFFHAGRTLDRRQVVIGLACPDLVAFFFDEAGNLLDVQTRRLEFLKPSRVLVDGEPIEGQVGGYNIYDERIPVRLELWQREIGFEPSVIRVRKFFVLGLGIGIHDYPEHFAEILDDPQSSEAEREDVRESMQDWDANGQFVLLWGNDYWVDGQGDVTSS